LERAAGVCDWFDFSSAAQHVDEVQQKRLNTNRAIIAIANPEATLP